MFLMFSHGITAFHGVKFSLRQKKSNEPCSCDFFVFQLFSKPIRNAWSGCYHGHVYTKKRHETQRNETMIFRVTKFQDSLRIESTKVVVFFETMRRRVYMFNKVFPQKNYNFIFYALFQTIFQYILSLYISFYFVSFN